MPLLISGLTEMSHGLMADVERIVLSANPKRDYLSSNALNVISGDDATYSRFAVHPDSKPSSTPLTQTKL
jgi:hypothetical protein